MINENFDFTDDLQKAGPNPRFQQVLVSFLRAKWIIIVCVAIGALAMTVHTLRSKPIFMASSMVLINPKVQAGNLPFADLLNSSPNKITNEIAILKSVVMAENVAKALLRNPYTDSTRRRMLSIVQVMKNDKPTGVLETVQHVGGRVRRSMGFEPQRESDLIRIIARGRDRIEVAALANTYAEVYQAENLRASRTHSTELREFLEERLQEQRRSLSRAEDSVKKFMEYSGIGSLDGTSNEVVSQLAQLEASRNAIDIDIQTLAQTLSAYQRELPEQESNISKTIGQASDPYIRMVQEQLARLEVQRDVIISQNDPEVVRQEPYKQKLLDIEEQIVALRQRLQTRSRELIKSLSPEGGGGTQSDPLGYLRQLKEKMLETRIELQSLQSKKEALDRIIQEYERKFRSLPRRSLELAKLQRARLSTEKLYLLVEEKYNEATFSEKSEFGYISIVDRASVPFSPESPNVRVNLLLGILAGLGFGVAIAYLRDFLDVRVRTPDDVRRRGLVPLTEIPPMHRELRKLREDNNLPREVLQFDEHLRLIFNPISFLSESYRRLRTNILRVQLNRPLRAIMVTSPNPYEGKSTTICNLAITFAETQKKVLLVDADIRRPNVHTNFGIVPMPGLTDLLYGKASFEEVVHRNVVDNLDIIPAGTIIRNPGKLFGSNNMQSFLAQMEEMYTWVFLDTPPILIVNDAAVLATLVDGTILVLSSGSTRAATLDRAVDFLNGAGGTILGGVLNKFDAKKTYGGYYGSHRYGHYGSDYGYYSSGGKKKQRTVPGTKWLSLKR